jgi:hypothetical protein
VNNLNEKTLYKSENSLRIRYPRILRGHADRSIPVGQSAANPGSFETLIAVHKSLRIKGQCAERVRTATNHDDDRNQHCLDPRTAWRIRADTCGFAERSDGEPTRQPPFAFARKAGKLCRAAIAEMVHVKHRRSDAQTVPSLQARDFQRNAQADFDSVPTTMPVPKGLPGGEHRRDGRVGCIWLGSIERLARSLRLNPRWMYSLSDAGPKQLTAPKAPTCGLGTRNCPQDCGCPRCPQAIRRLSADRWDAGSSRSYGSLQLGPVPHAVG